MSEPTHTILQSGERVFVLHRPIVSGETRRHFFGVVDDCHGTLARVTGRLFSLDSKLNQFVSRDLPRTRIIPLGSAAVVVNVLPASVNIDQITYSSGPGGKLHITDGSMWHLDINPV